MQNPKTPTGFNIPRKKRSLDNIDWAKAAEIGQKHGFSKPLAEEKPKPAKTVPDKLDGRRLRKSTERNCQLNLSLTQAGKEQLEALAGQRSQSKAAVLRAGLETYKNQPLPAAPKPAENPHRLCLLLSRAEKQILYNMAENNKITFNTVFAAIIAAETAKQRG